MALDQLRVLSGRHAGACVHLSPGVMTLGPDPGSDIVVTDWTFAPLTLHIDPDGLTAEWTLAAGGGRQRRRLVDRQAAEFDGSVICAGPSDAEWPPTAELLSAIFDPAGTSADGGSRIPGVLRRPAVVAAAAGCAVIAVAAALWFNLTRPPAPTLEGTRMVLQRAVDSVAAQRFQVGAEGGALVIAGMADSAEQGNAVRAVVEGARGVFAVIPRFSVATDVAETIRGAVELSNGSVTYLGDGAFRMSGATADPDAAKAAIERVRADLAPAVRRIDSEIVAIERQHADVPILSNLQSGNVLVMQTRDGVKHIVVRPEEPVMTDRAVLSLPAPEPSMFPPDRRKGPVHLPKE